VEQCSWIIFDINLLSGGKVHYKSVTAKQEALNMGGAGWRVSGILPWLVRDVTSEVCGASCDVLAWLCHVGIHGDRAK
jgi:hypothetical protein